MESKTAQEQGKPAHTECVLPLMVLHRTGGKWRDFSSQCKTGRTVTKCQKPAELASGRGGAAGRFPLVRRAPHCTGNYARQRSMGTAGELLCSTRKPQFCPHLCLLVQHHLLRHRFFTLGRNPTNPSLKTKPLHSSALRSTGAGNAQTQFRARSMWLGPWGDIGEVYHEQSVCSCVQGRLTG